MSAQLVALALGATTGDVCDVGTWAVARVKRLWAARRPRRRRITQLISEWATERNDETQGDSASTGLGLELNLNVASKKV